MIFSFLILGWSGPRIYQEMTLIPDKFVTSAAGLHREALFVLNEWADAAGVVHLRTQDRSFVLQRG